MVGEYDPLRSQGAIPKTILPASSGLLPPGMREVGLIDDGQGWQAYCEYGSSGGFMPAGQNIFIRSDRGTGSAINELASWMFEHWHFERARAREVAWRLLEAAAAHRMR
jgi:hypothetical protein